MCIRGKRVFMKSKSEAKRIIQVLQNSHAYAECPCCKKHIMLKEAGLFYLDDFSPEAEELYQRRCEQLDERRQECRDIRRAMKQTSRVGAEAVNIGLILERIAPLLKSFPYDRNDCRSLFDPIDYIVFDGLSRNKTVNNLVFIDVKTGRSRLTGKQPEIRSLIERNQVIWDTYRVEEKE